MGRLRYYSKISEIMVTIITTKKPHDDLLLTKFFNTYGIFHGLSLALKETNAEIFYKLAQNTVHVWRRRMDRKAAYPNYILFSLRHCKRYFDTEKDKYFVDKIMKTEF